MFPWFLQSPCFWSSSLCCVYPIVIILLIICVSLAPWWVIVFNSILQKKKFLAEKSPKYSWWKVKKKHTYSRMVTYTFFVYIQGVLNRKRPAIQWCVLVGILKTVSLQKFFHHDRNRRIHCWWFCNLQTRARNVSWIHLRIRNHQKHTHTFHLTTRIM